MHLTLALTRACNLDCTYCYAGQHVPDHMNIDTAKRAIDMAASLGTGNMRLMFFGGEPLLRWDDLLRCIDYAETVLSPDGRGLDISLTTNGTLLSPQRADVPAGRGVQVTVSVDGNKTMHDVCRRKRDGRSSFDEAIAGLRAMLEVSRRTVALTVVDPSNVAFLTDGIRYLLDDAHAAHVACSPNYNVEWDDSALLTLERAYEELAQTYIERYLAGRPLRLNVFDTKIVWRLDQGASRCGLCGFATHEMAVAPSGRIYPCERMIGDDDGRHAIGSISEGIDDTRRDSIATRHAPASRPCNSCRIATRCASHCRATNHAATASFDDPGDSFCKHERIAARIADRIGDVLLARGSATFVEDFIGCVPTSCR